MLKLELLVSRAREKLDVDGNLTDPQVCEGLRALLFALIEWSRRLRGESPQAGS